MNSFRIKYLIPILFLFLGFKSEPHDYEITFKISNQSPHTVILSQIKGDKTFTVDSIIISKESLANGEALIQFNMPSDTPIGMYRLTLGKTLLAEVLNEDQQQLDFIFNNEDIVIQTDFNAPVDSLKVLQSEENKVWFDFKRKYDNTQELLEQTELDLNYYQAKNDTVNTDIKAVEYNQIQRLIEEQINNVVKSNPDLFASKLIETYKEPYLNGNLSKEERLSVYKANYFNQLDFSDTTLINSSRYTESVFSYLMSYAQKGLSRVELEQELINAMDVILANTNQNQEVYEFIFDYLVRGMERLNMETVIAYLADNYLSTCESDEKSTFERKLASYEMKIGDYVSDINMNDINGDPFTLSQVLKNKNLLVFWASWCPHCTEELPAIFKWYEKQNQNELEVIAISIDTAKVVWENMVYNLGIESWYNLCDFQEWDGQATKDYNIYATPTMFVIDKNLKILGKPLTINELPEFF